jgi:hypothetical protein
MNSKYFLGKSIVEWFRIPNKSSVGSLVWKAFVSAFALVGPWTAWKVGDGRMVRLGEDLWVGSGNRFNLSTPLIVALRARGLHTLADACAKLPQLRGRAGWKSVTLLDLTADLAQEWDDFLELLCGSYVTINPKVEDSLCWSYNSTDGSFTAKLGYKD